MPESIDRHQTIKKLRWFREDARRTDDIYSAVAVPKGHDGWLAYINEFIEDAKVSGLVNRMIETFEPTPSAVKVRQTIVATQGGSRSRRHARLATSRHREGYLDHGRAETSIAPGFWRRRSIV